MAPATVRELSAAFGLTHPDSVRNLIRRADRALLDSRILHGEIEAIRHRLPKTGPDPRSLLESNLGANGSSSVSAWYPPNAPAAVAEIRFPSPDNDSRPLVPSPIWWR